MTNNMKRVKHNTKYYFIIVGNGHASVFDDIEINTELNNDHFNAGNYFTNKKDANIVANQINSLFIYNKNKYKH